VTNGFRAYNTKALKYGYPIRGPPDCVVHKVKGKFNLEHAMKAEGVGKGVNLLFL